METGIVEIINVAQGVAWLPWAVQYSFLIGLSVGGLLLSLPGYALARAEWRALGRLGLVVALGTGFTAQAALLSDLHQPGRFWAFYLAFRPSSWMWWGALILPFYSGTLLLYAWTCFREELDEQGRVDSRLARFYRLAALGGGRNDRLIRATAVLALAGAAAIALYSGAEVAVVRARPLWHSPFPPVLLLVSALAGAAGLVLVLNRFAGGGTRDVESRASRLLSLFLAAFALLVLAWLLAGLAGMGSSPLTALAGAATPAAVVKIALLATALTALPLVLTWAGPAGGGMVTGLLGLAGAWAFRWGLFIGGQMLPKNGAGIYDYALPPGSDGLLGLIGTFGLWLFLTIAITSALPLPRKAAGPRTAGHSLPAA